MAGIRSANRSVHIRVSRFGSPFLGTRSPTPPQSRRSDAGGEARADLASACAHRSAHWHVPSERRTMTVLDPASGSRMFYFDKNDPRVLFGDIRDESHTLVDGRALEIHPDVQMDFRDLPFKDDSFRVVIFDPPHLNKVGMGAWMGKKYGILGTTWRDDLRLGFSECFRVLHPNGVLIFKWNETQIPLRDILALTPEKPLVGHRSGKTARTHWVTFIKPTS